MATTRDGSGRQSSVMDGSTGSPSTVKANRGHDAPATAETITEERRIGDRFRVLARGKSGALRRDDVGEAPPVTYSDASIFNDLCAELGLAPADVVSLDIGGDVVTIERVDGEAVGRAAAREAERAAAAKSGDAVPTTGTVTTVDG